MNDNLHTFLLSHNFYRDKKQQCKDCKDKRDVYIYKHVIKNDMLWIIPQAGPVGNFSHFVNKEGVGTFSLNEIVTYIVKNYSNGG